MVNRILIDTNILLDYLLTRDPFYGDASNIVSVCVDGKVEGCIAAHSVSKERREILSNLCSIFDVEGIDKSKLMSGL